MALLELISFNLDLIGLLEEFIKNISVGWITLLLLFHDFFRTYIYKIPRLYIGFMAGLKEQLDCSICI
jgi:hypothetical protein